MSVFRNRKDNQSQQIKEQIEFEYYLGNCSQIYFEIFLIAILATLVIINKKKGLYLINLQQQQNTYQAYQLNTLKQFVNKSQDSQLEIKFQKEIFQYEKEIFIKFLNSDNEQYQGFFYRNFSQYSFKQGADYYPMTVALMFLIMAYIFIFFNQLQKDSSNFDNVQFQNIQGDMALIIIIHFIMSLVDRAIRQMNFKDDTFFNKNRIRYIYLSIQLILATLYCFEFASKNETYYIDDKTGQNHTQFTSNKYAIILYFIYCLYFLLQSLQIQYGYKSSINTRYLMRKYNYSNLIIYQVFYAIPFVFEIKIFLDWSITQTSLFLYDWFTFEVLYRKLYMAKCDSQSIKGRELGSLVPKITKIIQGFCGLIFIIVLIFGPMILFSTYVSPQVPNKLTELRTQISFLYKKTNQYQFYKNDHIDSISCFTQQEYDQIRNQSISNVPNKIDCSILNKVDMNTVSQNMWGISQGNLQLFQDQINQTIQINGSINLLVQFSFKKVSSDYANTDGLLNYQYPISNQTLQQLYNITTQNCTQGDSKTRTIELKEFYSQQISLKDNTKPQELQIQNKTTAYLNIQCDESAQYKYTRSYWSLSLDSEINQGLTFFIITDYQVPSFQGYSMTTIYISFVYVIGKVLRLIIEGSQDIILSKQPRPDQLIQICDAILIARNDKDFIKEQELYYYLLDIIRSPETIKAISGLWIEFVKEDQQKQ